MEIPTDPLSIMKAQQKRSYGDTTYCYGVAQSNSAVDTYRLVHYFIAEIAVPYVWRTLYRGKHFVKEYMPSEPHLEILPK